MDDAAVEIREEWEQLKGDRTTWEVNWQQCSNYLHPERATYITERSPGQKVMRYVYDGTPMWAHEQFANGMHGFLTSPDTQWFGLACDDDRINADYDCRAWYDAAAKKCYEVFASPRYNFASASHEYYLDLGCPGTAIMSEIEGPGDKIQFSTRHLKQCVISENEEDRIDRIVRRWQWTARQAYREWGEAAGERVCKSYADGKPHEKFWFLHRVKPRTDRDPTRADKRHKPFESIYVAEADGAVIGEGGFDEFPFLCTRFMKSTDEIYGRSPGQRLQPDTQMLNEMIKTLLKAAQKVVDPPLMLPNNGYLLPLRTSPGARIFYEAGQRPTDRLEPLLTKGDIPIGRELLNDTRQMIIRGFYVDWFIMPSDMSDPASDGKGVTATFTTTQRQQKMRQASGMLARMQGEFTGPLVERTFNILWRRSKAMKFGPGSPFPPPPAKISGRPLHVTYVSPMAIAQQSELIDTTSRLVQTALGLMQVDPDAGHVVDSEAILRRASQGMNAPADALRSPAVMAQMRAQAAQQAQQAQAQQQAMDLAKAGKDGTGALQNLASMQAQGAAQQAAGAGYAPQPQQQAA